MHTLQVKNRGSERLSNSSMLHSELTAESEDGAQAVWLQSLGYLSLSCYLLVDLLHSSESETRILKSLQKTF